MSVETRRLVGNDGDRLHRGRRNRLRCWHQGDRVDANPALLAADRLELHVAVDFGVDRVVLTDADVVADVKLGAALADDDRPGADKLPVRALDAEALRAAVAADIPRR